MGKRNKVQSPQSNWTGSYQLDSDGKVKDYSFLSFKNKQTRLYVEVLIANYQIKK